jgi:hypothetical protein
LILLGLAIVVAVMVMFRFRYSRTIVIRDLSTTSTQTVSVAFRPHDMRWKISGDVGGTGTVIVPYIYSNTVSGKFSANGAGDYYDTNVSLIFVPNAQAAGIIRGSFFFKDY